MVESLLAGEQIRVALLNPGTAGQTAHPHFGAAFAKVMRQAVDLDYFSETSGEYNGIVFRSIADFKPADFDVVHFQWGNNPLHLFEFSVLLDISRRAPRPRIISTLHEAELGYLIGASSQALRYRWRFKLRRNGRAAPHDGSDYQFFSHHTVAEILARSDRVIVHSEYTKKRLVNEHQFTAEQSEKIQVARLGIDWDDYRLANEPVHGIDERDHKETMVLLYVGTLFDIKSLPKIIRALHLVRSFGRRDDFYFVIVGAGPEYGNLHALAASLIPGQYAFAGKVPSVLPYYQLADVVVCPRAFTRGEISGAIPEACGAGRPIILPNIGGWGEYIDDSRGFLVNADDELDYAEAIVGCLQNRSEVKKKGINARLFAENSLSWQSQMDFYRSIYSNTVSR